jgi:pimeloyl-ACP methyl ester carboxylesterase
MENIRARFFFLSAFWFLLPTAIGMALSINAFSQTDTLSITLENVRYPYPVKFFNVEIGCQDLRMAYMDVKPKQAANGKTVILFHGKNFGGYYWGNVINKLSDAGFRVIVPDQIGFGKSSKPFIQYSFHALATQNKKLMDSLGIDRIIVLGHSMGGMLATRFALMYPHRVEKLVLENPIGLEDYRSIVPYVSIEEQYKTELQTTTSSVKRYYQNSYFPTWKQDYEYLVTIASGVTNSSEFPRYAKVAALTYQMIYEQPVVHEFPLLSVPTFLIIGTKDKTVVGKDKLSKEMQQQYGNYAVLGKQTASKIKGAKLIELNAGHIPHIEIADQFIAELLGALK